MDLSKQYNDFAKKFSDIHDEATNGNRENRRIFYGHLDFIKPGMKLLDLACGDGLDLIHYKSLGADVSGLDASEDLVEIARKRNPEADVRVGLFEQMPFEEGTFDVVLSKYALQTSPDMTPAFSEIHRVLKSGGTMMYLVTHPFRQFFERKGETKDYFEQTIVDSNIFNGSVTIKEPTHTFNEYFTDFLFDHFDVQLFREHWDTAAEQIDGKTYPGYFILKAKKR